MANPGPKLRPTTLIAVALGGMLGAAARVFLPWPSLLDDSQALINPLPTAIVNLIGSAMLGLVSGYTMLRRWPEPLHKGVTTGFLGTFTTMSALAMIYVAFVLWQAVEESVSFGTGVLTFAVITALLVVFLCLTTWITTGTYRLGKRLAAGKA